MSLCLIEENEVSIITPTAIQMENYFGITGKKMIRKQQQHNQVKQTTAQPETNTSA